MSLRAIWSLKGRAGRHVTEKLFGVTRLRWFDEKFSSFLEGGQVGGTNELFNPEVLLRLKLNENITTTLELLGELLLMASQLNYNFLFILRIKFLLSGFPSIMKSDNEITLFLGSRPPPPCAVLESKAPSEIFLQCFPERA